MSVRIWLALLGVVLGLSASGCGTVSQRNQMNWQSLSADATDGSVLADLILSGRAGRTFARAHAQELQDDADQVRMNVSDEQAPGHQRLEKVAEELSSALGDIVAHPADPPVARRTKEALRSLSGKIPKASS